MAQDGGFYGGRAGWHRIVQVGGRNRRIGTCLRMVINGLKTNLISIARCAGFFGTLLAGTAGYPADRLAHEPWLSMPLSIDSPARPYSIAATPAGKENTASTDWSVDVFPYLWLQNTAGTVRNGDTTIDLTASFIDYARISDDVRFGFVKAEWRFGRFGGYVDFAYGLNGIDIDVGPTRVGGVTVPQVTGRLEASQTVIDLVGFYRVYESGKWAAADRNDPLRISEISLDLLVGVRYTRQKLELSLSANGPLTIKIGPIEIRRPLPDTNIKEIDEIFDPIIGARAIVRLAPRWSVMLRGDVGGFGVGSEFTWNLVGLVSYHFKVFGLDADVGLGYRGLYQHTISGSGAEKVVSRITYHGPIFGARIRF